MKSNIYTYITGLMLLLSTAFISCEQETLEPELSIGDGAGTLTDFMAYSLDSIPGEGGVYGRIVFWKGLDGKTLIQLSLHNVPESVSFPSAIFGGTVASPSATSLMDLYPIENTGEGYGFGEFSTSKYYVISDSGFFDGLTSLDAHIQILASDTDATLISAGDIGLNATPVETN